jgi:hypothetical protein
MFKKEIKLALDVADEKPRGTIFIIPAPLDDCQVPEQLSGLQRVDLYSSHGYERLISALRARDAQRPRVPETNRPDGSTRDRGEA